MIKKFGDVREVPMETKNDRNNIIGACAEYTNVDEESSLEERRRMKSSTSGTSGGRPNRRPALHQLKVNPRELAGARGHG